MVPLSLSPLLSLTHKQQQHEFAGTAPGANHKYFKCHHSYLYTQQKGENKVHTYVQYVTSPASLAIISWTLNKTNLCKHDNLLLMVAIFATVKLNILMYLNQECDLTVSIRFRETLSSGYGYSCRVLKQLFHRPILLTCICSKNWFSFSVLVSLASISAFISQAAWRGWADNGLFPGYRDVVSVESVRLRPVGPFSYGHIYRKQLKHWDGAVSFPNSTLSVCM